MLRQKPKARENWSVFDLMLIEAQRLLDEQTCKECGSPRWVCDSGNDANWLQFTVEIGFCKGKAAIDAWNAEEKKLQEKNQSKLRDGEYAYPVPIADGGAMYPDIPRGSSKRPGRQSWIKSKSEGDGPVD